MVRPRVKICCIQDRWELELAVRGGADAVGIVSAMPSGPGPISDVQCKALASAIPPGIDCFLLTSLVEPESIIAQAKFVRPTVIQLVDTVESDAYSALRQALPGIQLVQVIHVRDEGSIKEALTAAEKVDAILLDSGNQILEIKELGGTGRTHDWSISRQIVQFCRKPVWLAGGLNSANIRRAIDEVKPYGVDICSGLRTGDKLSTLLVEEFFEAISGSDP